MRIIASFAFLVIILFPGYSQNNNYELSLGAQFGLIHGQSLELVYPLPSDTKNDLLSELIYDLKPVFYYGLTANFGKKNPYISPGLFASLSFKAGIPGGSGTHENRDWLSARDDSLTNLSSHKNITKEMFIADVILGASIPIASRAYIKPLLSGSWMRFSFSGREGYRTYENENWEIIPFKSEVITYQQDWLLLAIGFSIGTENFYPFCFDFTLKLSPFTYCAATDHHVEKNFLYKDYTNFGFYYEPEINISIYLKQIELSLNFAYRNIGRTKGESYIKENKEPQYFLSSNKAGAGLSIIDTRFLVTWHFKEIKSAGKENE